MIKNIKKQCYNAPKQKESMQKKSRNLMLLVLLFGFIGFAASIVYMNKAILSAMETVNEQELATPSVSQGQKPTGKEQETARQPLADTLPAVTSIPPVGEKPSGENTIKKKIQYELPLESVNLPL